MYPGLCDHISTTWLPAPATSRDVPALQAADLIVWEVRKAHFGMKEWQNLRGDGHEDRWSAWQDYLESPGEKKARTQKYENRLMP